MIHVYTGTGKGKTTAALGLCLRAAGAGLRVYVGQFAKKGRYSEIRMLAKIPGVTVEQFGRRCFIAKPPSAQDRSCAAKGWQRAQRALADASFDMVVLDELPVVIAAGLLDEAAVLAALARLPARRECVITGRFASRKLCRAADLVSEVVCRKHYFEKGVRCRRGIEY